jgi:hypothetical protein
MSTKPPIEEFTSDELIAELRKRSLGCLVVSMRADENGQDEWHYALKGTPILLGAMHAGLHIQIVERLAAKGGKL